MITLVSFTKNIGIPYLISYGEGVYLFNFVGDTTYIDGDGLVWTWERVQTAPPVIYGIRTYTEQLVEVATLQTCIDNDGTWYYDSGNLYVHWSDNAGDISINRYSTVLQVADSDRSFSNKYNKTTKNIYNGIYYKPSIIKENNFTLAADSLSFGLFNIINSSVELDNADGSFDGEAYDDYFGGQVDVKTLSEEAGIDYATNRFRGYTNGANVNDSTYSINVIERRYYKESQVCRNKYTEEEYPNIDGKYNNKLKPVALGYIRAGKCIPVNTNDIDLGQTNNIIFSVSDPSLGKIESIDALYDSNGKEIESFAHNLIDCTISITLQANSNVDINKFTWDGKGLAENYDAPIDIMLWAFTELAGVPYISDTCDLTSWEALRTEYNGSARIGMQIQSSKSFISEVLEPISYALQIIIYSKGDGRLAVVSRDTSAASVRDISYSELLAGVEKDREVKDYASSIVIDYSISPQDKNNYKQLLYTGEGDEAEQQTIRTYGKQSTGRFSPIKTVFYDDNDSRITEFASSILDIANAPQDIVSIQAVMTDDDIIPFSIITCDLGRSEGEDNQRIEVNSISYDYMNYTVNIIGRVLD